MKGKLFNFDFKMADIDVVDAVEAVDDEACAAKEGGGSGWPAPKQPLHTQSSCWPAVTSRALLLFPISCRSLWAPFEESVFEESVIGACKKRGNGQTSRTVK